MSHLDTERPQTGLEPADEPERTPAAEAEERLRRSTAELVRLARSPRFRGDDLEGALVELTEAAVRGLQVPGASLWLTDDALQVLRLADRCEGPPTAHTRGAELPLAPLQAHLAALAAGGPVAVDGGAVAGLHGAGTRAGLHLAVRLRGEVAGVLALEGPAGGRGWRASELALAGALGDLASLALEAAERARVEAALLQSERRFKDLFQYTSDATVLYRVALDGSVYCEDFNPAAEAATGLKRDDVIGRRAREVVEPGSAGKLEERYAQAIRTRAPIVYEQDLQLPAGTRWFNTAIVPFLDETGRVYRLASIARDVTLNREGDALQRRLESQLAESQKTEALARLASHIAHDVNALLADIVGHAQALAAVAPQGAGAILEATARGRELTQQVMTFGRRRPPDRKPLDLQALVKGTLALLEPFRGGVELSLREAPGPVRVRADVSQLDQVVTTLCMNALQALGGRGTLSVGVELTEVDYAFATAHPPLQAGRWACLTVADTGAGLEEAARKRIFEPFFGSRATGRGTGMELAVAQAIVQAHGGGIVVDAAPGQGSRFRVFLPAQGEDEGQRPGLGQHLMLVDDHPGMARVSGRLLETLGYRATVYDDPREALAAFQARPEAFDAVLTDLCMPQMSGEDFTRSLRQLRPPLPIIVSSGLASELDPRQLEELGVSAVLMKPWRLEEVVAILKRVLP